MTNDPKWREILRTYLKTYHDPYPGKKIGKTGAAVAKAQDVNQL
jgi:hypothetical protein